MANWRRKMKTRYFVKGKIRAINHGHVSSQGLRGSPRFGRGCKLFTKDLDIRRGYNAEKPNLVGGNGHGNQNA